MMSSLRVVIPRNDDMGRATVITLSTRAKLLFVSAKRAGGHRGASIAPSKELALGSDAFNISTPTIKRSGAEGPLAGVCKSLSPCGIWSQINGGNSPTDHAQSTFYHCISTTVFPL